MFFSYCLPFALSPFDTCTNGIVLVQLYVHVYVHMYVCYEPSSLDCTSIGSEWLWQPVTDALALCTQCKELVDKFTDELIQFIEADLPPNEICKVCVCPYVVVYCIQKGGYVTPKELCLLVCVVCPVGGSTVVGEAGGSSRAAGCNEGWKEVGSDLTELCTTAVSVLVCSISLHRNLRFVVQQAEL